MAGSFQATLEHIRALADSEARKGRLFERLIKAYLLSDPLYRNRFSAVHLWSEWASSQDGFDGTDIGIHARQHPQERSSRAAQEGLEVPQSSQASLVGWRV